MTTERPVLLKHDQEAPGDWVAICLDNDVMSQGRDKDHALVMLREAVDLCKRWDAEEGSKIVREPSPEEYWAEWHACRLAGDTLDTVATVLLRAA